MQAEERLEPDARRLGDHLAGAVGVEAVDHHPVEPGDDFQLPRGFLGELLDSPGLPNAAEHQADHLAGIQPGSMTFGSASMTR